jgi:hypothetical protein
LDSGGRHSQGAHVKITALRKLIIVSALAVLVFASNGLAAAQSGASLTLRSLETEAFPLIAGYLDARDPSGARITNLVASQLQVLEDGQPQPIAQLRSVQPGLRIILVINPAEPFNIRDGEGTTRFDHAKRQILDWANSLPSDNATSLSLVTPQGILAADQSAASWITTLDGIQPDFPEQPVDTQVLARALELAAQAGPEPGMGTAILWVTPTPPQEALVDLPNLQASLLERGIPLFVWQIDANSNLQNDITQSLQAFAQASGGQWFGFSSNEEFPEPESYFSPLRSAYFFQYDSQLHTAGVHQVQLQMDAAGTMVTSQILSFDLDIQPPNPILVDPPAQILRAPSPQDAQQLAPFSQPIEIIIEFPDKFERDLVRSTLFVNDDRVAENTSAPFTRFAWDLSSYGVSQQFSIRVEAEDELGLVGSSVEVPVQVLVTIPASGLQALFSRGGLVLAITVPVIAAAAFLLVMVLSGRLKPSQISSRLFKRTQPTPAVIDPLNDSPLASSGSQAIPPLNSSLPNAPAYLQRLIVQDVNAAPQFLPIDQAQVVIGADKKCGLVIEEESVSSQHARLTRMNSTYQVADLGSEAGTWVNYAPVSAEGSLLRDGDLLHIGRVAFRFLLQPSEDDSAGSR